MSIYYYGELIGTYEIKQKQASVSDPVLVGDIIKNRADYQAYRQPKKQLKIRHFQEA